MSVATEIALSLAFAGLGAFVAGLHLVLLSWGVRNLLHQARMPLAAAVPFVRIPVTVAAFALVAAQGPIPLTAMLAGFLIVRTALTRRPEALLS